MVLDSCRARYTQTLILFTKLASYSFTFIVVDTDEHVYKTILYAFFTVHFNTKYSTGV
jgi:hypothetical protein